MPCDTVQTSTINLGKVDRTLLTAALKSLGITRWQYNGDKLVLSGRDATSTEEAQVKVAYSQQVVFSQCKKYGWQMKEIGKNQWEVLRR